MTLLREKFPARVISRIGVAIWHRFRVDIVETFFYCTLRNIVFIRIDL